jgi:hypothetical protein
MHDMYIIYKQNVENVNKLLVGNKSDLEMKKVVDYTTAKVSNKPYFISDLIS